MQSPGESSYVSSPIWNSTVPAENENQLLTLMLEKDLAQNLRREREDEGLHVFGVDMVGERLIVVAERGAAPDDLMPLVGSHQRHPPS